MKTNLLKVILCAFCLWGCQNVLLSQHPHWRQYTTKDGLPDNQVNDIFQDSRAVLWLATQHGICYFNGYEFRQPADTSLILLGSTLKIVEDSNGIIWFNNPDGALFYITNDTIRHYAFNHLIKPFGRTSRLNYRFAFDEAGTLWVGANKSGYLTISRSGQLTEMTVLPDNTFFINMVGNQVLAGQKTSDDLNIRGQLRQPGLFHFNLVNITGNQQTWIGQIPDIYFDSSVGFDSWLLKNGDIAIFLHQISGIVHRNRLLWYSNRNRYIKDIAEDKAGNILAAVVEGADKGVQLYSSPEDFQKNRFENLLPHQKVTAVVCDHEGGYWAATFNSGIFYCSNPSLSIFDSPFQAHGIIKAVATDGYSTIFAGLYPAKIMALDIKTNTVRSLGISTVADHSPVLDFLKYDLQSKSLWTGPGMFFWQNNSWNIPQYFNNGKVIRNPGYIKTISQASIQHTWLGSSFMGFYSIDPVHGMYQLVPDTPLTVIRTLSASSDYDGNTWVVTQDGLQQWKNGQYLAPAMFPADEFKKVRQVECLPDSSLLFVLENKGLLLYEKKGVFTHLTQANGLLSHKITAVKIAENGHVYVISSAGLNELSKNVRGSWNISSVTFKHGLPESQILDVVALNHDLWIAVETGIIRLKNKLPPVTVPPPVLESFRVNNEPVFFSAGMILPASRNNITIRFFAIHYRSVGVISYRYRVLSSDTTFTHTENREILLVNLAPGTYRIAIQAQNENGEWGEASVWTFSIAPHWWATWWFQSAITLLIVCFLYFYFRRRIARTKRLNLEKEQMRDLEQKALMAQMNPHFIFNCLQSIQSVVLQKDSDTAGNYLARFAKLIRLSLHGSVDGFHSLDDEIALLDSYLYLEQMRFNQSFDFRIDTKDIPDTGNIFFPPLLIQPFVENALLHGIFDRTAGGKVEISFSHQGKELHIEITDNGTNAISTASRTHTYKSVGMLLTQQRIALMRTGNTSGRGLPEMEELRDAAGNKTGTRVRFVIPVDSHLPDSAREMGQAV